MKKTIIICLIAALIVGVSGCSSSYPEISYISKSTTNASKDSSKDKFLDEYGDIYAEWTIKEIEGEYDYVINAFENLDDKFVENSNCYKSLSEIYEKCKKAKKENNWKVSYYVDDFGDKTDQKYIKYVGSGTFSNSATTNSLLTFSILADTRSGISIQLYEYGNSIVKNSYSHEKRYTVNIKNPNGNKETLDGYINSNGNRIFMYTESLLLEFKLASEDGTIKFHIVENDRPTTYYDFEVNVSDFSAAYAELSE